MRGQGLVLVVGPDGAGKTTVLDEVQEQLGSPLARAHYRPGLIAGRSGDATPVTDPHGQSHRGTIASLLKLAVVFADTVLGTWLRWRPAARHGLLVVERGWYDLAVDPRRYRLPSSFTTLAAGLGRLVPRADLAVVLCGDPTAFHARKPEIGVAEVERQLTAWRRYAPRSAHRVVTIDTVDQSAQHAAAQLVAALPTGWRWRRVPLAPHRLDLCATGPGPALRIYRPHRRAAQFASHANPALLRLRLARRAAPADLPGLDDLLTRDGHRTTQLAVLRSSGPARWIVAAADDHLLHTVVKVGRGDDGLAREAAALRVLQATDTIALPTIVGEHRQDDWHALALAALPHTDQPPNLEQVVRLATALSRGDLGTPVVHGDLAPWNLAVDGDRVVVWDWEEAELDTARPLHDLTHYVVRSGTLLGHWAPAEAARLLTASDGPGARHLAALDLPPQAAADHIRRYLQRTEATTSAEHTYRVHLQAALPRRR